MPPTHVALSARLALLEKHFFPRKFSPLGNYSARQEDHTAAFVFLAHAEIESFCESLALSAVDRAKTSWQTTQKPSYVIWSLVLDLASRQGPEKPIREFNATDANRAITTFEKRVEANNGIKEENLLGLFQPIGLSKGDLDTTWLGVMNSFGKLRGKVAHMTYSARVAVNPKDEKTTIDDSILPGLLDLENKVNNLT